MADLAGVAAAYREGLAVGVAPVQRVQRFAGCSRAMATRLVRQAREAGYLAEGERAPVGGGASHRQRRLRTPWLVLPSVSRGFAPLG